ncbi:OmpA family protein [Pendulispora brunnea]|uniref:OmpA family protein n=1 Tax=Pendulispora brunnea TaxID=2905690 RepID=A0ABZ2KEU7_9BACT
MTSHRILPQIVAASLLLGVAACGGSTQFQSAQAVAINGTPPPPPPAPPPPPEAPKPPPRVELRDNKIDFKEKIQFQVNKAIIKEESFSLLHDIAEVIKQNPQVKKISIEGHASAEGNPAANKKLSDARAKAVAEFLVKKEGVDAARLGSKGWGSEKPIASNDNEEGREKNRRVEFLVTEQEVTAKKVEIDPATGKERVIDEKKSLVEAPNAAPAPAADAAADSKKLNAGDAKKKPGAEGAAKKPDEHHKKGDAKKPEEKK